MRWRALAGVAVLAASVQTAPAQEPHAPKLGAEPPAPAVRDETPAQALPAVITICLDRSVTQCWTIAGTGNCQSPSRPKAEVFATVGSGWPDAGKRLRACWDAVVK